MTEIVESFDPAKHGAIVCGFVTSEPSDDLGFRKNKLPHSEWQHLLKRADYGRFPLFLSVSGKNIAAIGLYRKFAFSEYRCERRYLFGRHVNNP